jgi:predicted DNA binding CopG/RHH family protein
MKKANKTLPVFKNEDEEREFWATHSPLDYFDTRSTKKAVFSDLKPSLKSISLRVPSDLLAQLKTLANKKDIPYQSLIKIFLARQVAIERAATGRSIKKKRTR